MSIKTEILTLQHIRFDVSLKIADIERTIEKVKSQLEGKEHPELARSESVCEDLRQLYDENNPRTLHQPRLHTRLSNVVYHRDA